MIWGAPNHAGGVRAEELISGLIMGVRGEELTCNCVEMGLSSSSACSGGAAESSHVMAGKLRRDLVRAFAATRPLFGRRPHTVLLAEHTGLFEHALAA